MAPSIVEGLRLLGATDADSVAAASAGHDAANRVVFAPGPGAHEVIATALPRTGVSRLVLITTGSLLEVATGVPFHDQPSSSADYRPFSAARAREVDLLRAGRILFCLRDGTRRFSGLRVPLAGITLGARRAWSERHPA